MIKKTFLTSLLLLAAVAAQEESNGLRDHDFMSEDLKILNNDEVYKAKCQEIAAITTSEEISEAKIIELMQLTVQKFGREMGLPPDTKVAVPLSSNEDTKISHDVENQIVFSKQNLFRLRVDKATISNNCRFHQFYRGVEVYGSLVILDLTHKLDWTSLEVEGIISEIAAIDTAMPKILPEKEIVQKFETYLDDCYYLNKTVPEPAKDAVKRATQLYWKYCAGNWKLIYTVGDYWLFTTDDGTFPVAGEIDAVTGEVLNVYMTAHVCFGPSPELKKK